MFTFIVRGVDLRWGKKKKKTLTTKDVDGDSLPLYYNTKAQTKNRRHLIAGVLDERQRARRNKRETDEGMRCI